MFTQLGHAPYNHQIEMFTLDTISFCIDVMTIDSVGECTIFFLFLVQSP